MAVRVPGSSGSTTGSVRNAKPKEDNTRGKTITDAANKAVKSKIVTALINSGYTVGSPAFQQALTKYSRNPKEFDKDFGSEATGQFIGRLGENVPRDTRALDVLTAFGFEDPIITAFKAASQLKPGTSGRR